MNLRSIAGLFITIFSCFVIVLMSFLFLPMKILAYLVRLYSFLTFKIYGIKFEVHGEENIDPGKSYIYVSNHSSLLDIPSVTLSLPSNVKFIAKKELFKIPLFGFAIKRLGQIPIDRKNRRKAIQSLEVAKERLHRGFSIWMAPEGTRNIDGDLSNFKKGAFVTARQAGVDIVPVSLCGTWNVLPKKATKIRPGKIDVYIHKPIKMNGRKVEEYIEQTQSIISEDIKNWKSVNEHQDLHWH